MLRLNYTSSRTLTINFTTPTNLALENGSVAIALLYYTEHQAGVYVCFVESARDGIRKLAIGIFVPVHEPIHFTFLL